jgi:hypothetical protein
MRCARDVCFESEEDGPNGYHEGSRLHTMVKIDW